MRDEENVRFQFSAAFRDDGAEEAVATVTYHRYDPSVLDISVHLLGSGDTKITNRSRFMQPKWNFFWLFSRSDHPGSVEVLGINGFSAAADTIRPDASAIQIDISTLPEVTSRKYTFTAQLTPSGILTRRKGVEIHYSGEIRNEMLEPGDVHVQTQLARVEATEYFQSFERTEHANRLRVMVERATLTGEITLHIGQAMSDLHEELRTVLNDVCDLLSLCYRIPVTYYEIEYFEIEPRTGPLVRTPLLRRKLTPTERREGSDDLINFRDLVNGGLDMLYQAYRRHPERIAIGRAIRFMVGSHAAVGLEQSYFLAYAALEAAMGAAANDTIAFALGSSPFRRLCSHLRATVATFATQHGFPRLEEDLQDKLSELRRRSAKRKITDIREMFDISVDDLWPQIGFESGFARATKARNHLVHEATIADPSQLHRDRVRIWVLTERLILKLLAWPDEKIWRWYDQDLRGVNQDEELRASPIPPVA